MLLFVCSRLCMCVCARCVCASASVCASVCACVLVYECTCVNVCVCVSVVVHAKWSKEDYKAKFVSRNRNNQSVRWNKVSNNTFINQRYNTF